MAADQPHAERVSPAVYTTQQLASLFLLTQGKTLFGPWTLT
jgi:hypothetical protein